MATGQGGGVATTHVLRELPQLTSRKVALMYPCLDESGLRGTSTSSAEGGGGGEGCGRRTNDRGGRGNSRGRSVCVLFLSALADMVAIT